MRKIYDIDDNIIKLINIICILNYKLYLRRKFIFTESLIIID
jgi:hypothetical protein